MSCSTLDPKSASKQRKKDIKLLQTLFKNTYITPASCFQVKIYFDVRFQLNSILFFLFSFSEFWYFISKLFWPTLRKNVWEIEKHHLQIKISNNLFEQCRSGKILTQNAFHGGFSHLVYQNNYNSKWKKLMGFRNLLTRKVRKEYV